MNECLVAQKLMSAGVGNENEGGGLNGGSRLLVQGLCLEVKHIGSFDLHKVSGFGSGRSASLMDPIATWLLALDEKHARGKCACTQFLVTQMKWMSMQRTEVVHII